MDGKRYHWMRMTSAITKARSVRAEAPCAAMNDRAPPGSPAPRFIHRFDPLSESM